MCEYCDDEQKRKDIDDNGEIKIYLDKKMGNNLAINYYHYGSKVGRYIPIVFCPMCGRLLNKELLDLLEKAGEFAASSVTVPLKPDIANINFQEQLKKIQDDMYKSSVLGIFPDNLMRGGTD